MFLFLSLSLSLTFSVCVCVCVRVRARVREYMCERTRVYIGLNVYFVISNLHFSTLCPLFLMLSIIEKNSIIAVLTTIHV